MAGCLNLVVKWRSAMLLLRHKSMRVLWSLAVVCVGSGCSHKPKTTQTDVIQIANAAAAKEGFILSEYKIPDARFEFRGRDWTWMVMYNLKHPTPWGPPVPPPRSAHGAPDLFFVTVDDRTGRARVGMLQPVGESQPISPPPGVTISGYTNAGWSDTNAK
jgi:hypothetical protein